ncbi:MAG: CinA family protein [Candidatus Izemoplasmatales bacterium]|jgi:PncC family amidohydrolase|nr:CinA family protein [Candidatus Izemoplasmatales bacterium]
MENLKEEIIRFREEFWLFDIDIKNAVEVYHRFIRPSRNVTVVWDDSEGEVKAIIEAQDQKALWRLKTKFKTVFSSWIITPDNLSLEADFYHLLKRKKWAVATAESVTGGMIAARILNVPGASDILSESYIVYSNEKKISVLGVDPEVIDRFGVLSWETAMAMVEKLAEKSKVQVAISTTGIAGPAGGSEEQPVGTIYFGFIVGAARETIKKQFKGSRNAIRKQATAFALGKVIQLCQEGRDNR